MKCPIYDLQRKYHVNIDYLALNHFVSNACSKCDGNDLECRTNQFFQEKRQEGLKNYQHGKRRVK